MPDGETYIRARLLDTHIQSNGDQLTPEALAQCLEQLKGFGITHGSVVGRVGHVVEAHLTEDKAVEAVVAIRTEFAELVMREPDVSLLHAPAEPAEGPISALDAEIKLNHEKAYGDSPFNRTGYVAYAPNPETDSRGYTEFK